MGMIGCLHRAGEADLQRVLREPRLVNYLIHDPEDFEDFDDFDEPGPPDPPFARVEGDGMNVDKAWHGIHYLLTGTAWEGDEPACYLVQGGEEVGDVDVGYGTARVIHPAQTRDFAEFLAPVTREALLSRYDAPRMRELDIYPSRLWDDGGDKREYVWDNFQVLRDFVATAAQRGEGLVIYIS